MEMQDEERKIEKDFLEKVGGVFKPISPSSKATTQAAVREDKSPEKRLLDSLRKLESGHQSKIDIYSRKIRDLGEEQKKLENALDTLKHLNLGIPAEYTKKLDDYPEQIKKLETEIEQERLFLGYLQSRVFPLLEGK